MTCPSARPNRFEFRRVCVADDGLGRAHCLVILGWSTATPKGPDKRIQTVFSVRVGGRLTHRDNLFTVSSCALHNNANARDLVHTRNIIPTSSWPPLSSDMKSYLHFLKAPVRWRGILNKASAIADLHNSAYVINAQGAEEGRFEKPPQPHRFGPRPVVFPLSCSHSVESYSRSG